MVYLCSKKNNMHFHIRDSAYYAKVNRKRTQYKYISERLDMCLLSAVIDDLLGRTGTMLDCSCPRGK